MDPTNLDRASFEAWSAAVQGPDRRSNPVLPGQGSSLACFSADSITDFSQAEGDRIDFREMDANTTLAGELIQRIDGAGRTVLQGDINGDSVADFEIRILTGPVLNISDFYL